MELAEALELRRQGKLEQTCPSCSLLEAAGNYCTACGTHTGAALWHPTRRSEAQLAASATLAALNASRP
jgi:hypothetical protein